MLGQWSRSAICGQNWLTVYRESSQGTDCAKCFYLSIQHTIWYVSCFPSANRLLLKVIWTKFGRVYCHASCTDFLAQIVVFVSRTCTAEKIYCSAIFSPTAPFSAQLGFPAMSDVWNRSHSIIHWLLIVEALFCIVLRKEMQARCSLMGTAPKIVHSQFCRFTPFRLRFAHFPTREFCHYLRRNTSKFSRLTFGCSQMFTRINFIRDLMDAWLANKKEEIHDSSELFGSQKMYQIVFAFQASKDDTLHTSTQFSLTTMYQTACFSYIAS